MPRTTPPGTPTPEELRSLARHRFEELIAKRLAFTRTNQWVWRSLLNPVCIERTDAALTHLRQTLEAGIRRKEIPDENPAHQHRELLNARQEQLRGLLRCQENVARLARERDRYRDAIDQHQRACIDLDIIPEDHDQALWRALQPETGAEGN